MYHDEPSYLGNFMVLIDVYITVHIDVYITVGVSKFLH